MFFFRKLFNSSFKCLLFAFNPKPFYHFLKVVFDKNLFYFFIRIRKFYNIHLKLCNFFMQLQNNFVGITDESY